MIDEPECKKRNRYTGSREIDFLYNLSEECSDCSFATAECARLIMEIDDHDKLSKYVWAIARLIEIANRNLAWQSINANTKWQQNEYKDLNERT